MTGTGITRLAAFFAVIGLTSGAAMGEEDPYLWLEEVNGERAIGWVKEQNVRTGKLLEAEPLFADIRDKVLEVANSRARIPGVVKRGAFFYNFWQDEKHVRGVWRRTTLDEYRKAEPAWETVLDLDRLTKDEKENWVWKGSACLVPEYRHCLINLSRGGADAIVVREFDVREKSFVAGGFAMREAKGSATLANRNTLLVQTDFGAATMTKSGYPRTTREWKRGVPIEKASVIYEGLDGDVSISSFQVDQPGFPTRQFVRRALTTFTSELYLRDGEKLTRLDVPNDAIASYAQGRLWVRMKTDWSVGGKKLLRGSLVSIEFERFMKGERDFEVLFEPTERKSLAGWTLTKNYLILNELDNVRNRLYELKHKAGKWTRRHVMLPGIGTASISAIDADESDDYFLTLTDYLTPSTLLLARAGNDRREVLKSLPAFFDSGPYKVEQFAAASRDGERIPYFLVANKNTRLDGNNPTLLHGYGGFEVSQLPGYSASVGNAWLKNGGVYVVANVRGGGEFGPRWHQAGLKANRQKVFDDFIAVAEDLVARKITSPRHLGISGGSNGGLLVGAVAVQRPDLFKAVLCTVPLLDMKRYHKLHAGASWMAEYGDPDVPAEWEFISKYSPYQNVKAGVRYPKILFVTSTRDDRVHPAHARKMMARMMEQGHDVFYYENIEGGHAASANNTQLAYRAALQYSFLLRELK